MTSVQNAYGYRWQNTENHITCVFVCGYEDVWGCGCVCVCVRVRVCVYPNPYGTHTHINTHTHNHIYPLTHTRTFTQKHTHTRIPTIRTGSILRNQVRWPAAGARLLLKVAVNPAV